MAYPLNGRGFQENEQQELSDRRISSGRLGPHTACGFLLPGRSRNQSALALIGISLRQEGYEPENLFEV